MAHPQTAEAVDAPAPQSASEKAADFENYLFGDDEQEDETNPTEQEADPEADELELDGEEQETEEPEPEEESPAIDVPVSLNAEEKKVFAQLPPEAQQAWAASETRRNQQVQEATTKAADRERAAQTAAAQAEAQADQRRAAQLKAFMEPFRPTMPPPQLAQTDPASYIAAKAQYDFEAAQFATIEQQIETLGTQAQSNLQGIDVQSRVADLMTVPKLADPAARDDYVKATLGLVEELGLDPAQFEQVAGSEDFRALDKISEWKAKAERFDKAMAKQMQKVRAGKGKTLRPGAAPQASTRAANSDQAWGRVKSAPTKTAQADAMAEWLTASGHL